MNLLRLLVSVLIYYATLLSLSLCVSIEKTSNSSLSALSTELTSLPLVNSSSVSSSLASSSPLSSSSSASSSVSTSREKNRNRRNFIRRHKKNASKRNRKSTIITADSSSIIDNSSGSSDSSSSFGSGLLPSFSDFLIAPNTKWCGRGNSAGKYNHLGGASRADKCCRKHDHCKLFIKGLTSQWDLFNYRPYTLSHCSCDMRFRTCLKMASTSDANMVGTMFFNYIQRECFVLVTEKVCVQRSTETNQCLKTVNKRKAYVKKNKYF